MKTMTKRAFSFALALMLSLSIIVGIRVPAQAANVDYVYSGKYIYNWGTRGTVATFLSPNASKFYQDNNTSYLQLASLSGSSSESGVPSSALYKKLQDLMSSNQSYQTSYDATRSLFQYTDCQNSGKTSKKISSFYSGKEIGPVWDSGNTWNREHVWPNSKGNYSGNGENDIMMLRPTSTNENGSRGNKAYGQSSGYYNPNSESGGKYDLRGDTARIILFTYVRWNCTKASDNQGNSYSVFGTKGVFESKKVMLDWIKQDPVDTWELGRNDSVESITGTRNVFVDYPELAFLLFGEAVPANYQSPSKSTQTSSYKITATSSNSTYGKVSVSGSMINATPSSGYEVSGFKINSGKATVTQSGNTFVVNATSDVSITINFAKITCKHPNEFDIPGAPASCDVPGYTDGKYCPDCNKYTSGHAEIAATGHKYSDSKDTTCNVCGYVKGSTVVSKPTTPSSKPQANTSVPGNPKPNTNTSSKPQTDTTVSSDVSNDVSSNNQVGDTTDSSNISPTPDGNVEYTPDGIPNIITGNKKQSFPWWIIVVAVVVIGGGVAAVIIISKKYKKL